MESAVKASSKCKGLDSSVISMLWYKHRILKVSLVPSHLASEQESEVLAQVV